VEGRGIFEDEEEGDFAFFDEFLAVGFAEAGRDVPIDVADVVAEGVFHDLVELHAAAAEGGAIFAAEDIFHGVAHAPFELAEEGEWRLRRAGWRRVERRGLRRESQGGRPGEGLGERGKRKMIRRSSGPGCG
jgi:hypothetical protein